MPNLTYLAIGILVIAAIFGFIVFVQLACDRPSSKVAVSLHGLLALTGLGLVATYVYLHGAPLVSVCILGIAALGGLTLLWFDLRHKPISKLILVLHPLIAIIGLGLLIAYALF